MKNGCKLPSRWVLYHWGELRAKMGLWLRLVLQATFDGPINIEVFHGVEDEQPVCFEEAVVMRHNEGGMSRQRRMETYDLIRCKARMFCNISLDRRPEEIGMTLFMRTGARSFTNDAAVIDLFKTECDKFTHCQLFIAYSNNLTFCQQVELMSITDILVSTHGAQLTNMFLMDRNSSVMEFFPKGWLKLAGVGQYVYHWIASWSGMKHQGAYRDPNGEPCPYPEDDRR
uniref:Glycosyltransferase 61 catalytic domain-containing protein n=2 Tax=Chenopodium quinoa TaxID=63459 RepID=A0A803MCD0_CHEQI